VTTPDEWLRSVLRPPKTNTEPTPPAPPSPPRTPKAPQGVRGVAIEAPVTIDAMFRQAIEDAYDRPGRGWRRVI